MLLLVKKHTYIYMLSGNKRSYILQDTEVFSCGFFVAFTSSQRVNNFCILTLCVFQILMYVFFVVIVALCCVHAQDTIIFMNVYCKAC